ncbi:MAG: hypothetical protein OXH96_11850 [Spirochaetaceae bacterium]|nr:hypothetical protein [Spirochaetaceae bacterium]
MVRNGRLLSLAAIVLFALASCAPQPNELQDSADLEGSVAGFWLGLWHGFITPVTFVISLFSSGVGIYEAHNNGGWYNLGFLIGASVMLGGSGRASHSRRRQRDR